MRHLIIGAGPAGVVAAEHLRKYDPDGSVMLVGEEPEPPYSRMAIPYLLMDRIDERGTYLRKDPAHFDALGIEVVRDRVTAVDTGSQRVTLAGGGTAAYDRLLIATGASPIVPPIPGVDNERVHACWTLEDARRIAAGAGKGSSVVLIGAGFIGCIILEALAERGVDLTVVELEDRMVPRMLNETAGGLVGRWCEQRGVKLRVSSRVAAIEPGTQGRPLRVVVDGGESIAADIVIRATGVHSNIDFLDGSGVATDRGVRVNEYLETSVPGVYAAGDVAESRDFSTGAYVVQAIQPTAVEHGQAAALYMARGHGHPQRGTLNMNVLDTLGLVSSSFAQWMGVDGGDSAELVDADAFRYLNLQFQDDVLVGATALGLTDHVGVIRGLIQGRTRLGSWKNKLMADPTRLMEAYLASTLPVGRNAYVI
jgi:NADPH-dependent 2,4-dienoyl-CoA reductase/sulfur reductase-like enzyme